MNKQLETYNSQDTVIAISSFPVHEKRTDTKGNFNAVGWHTEKTLKELTKHRKVIVLAEEAGKRKYEMIGGRKVGRSEGRKVGARMTVVRLWKKGSPFSFIKLYHFIKQFNNISSIYVPFEFNVFGGIIPNLELLMLLGLLRMSGKHITFELHQVILDIAQVEKHTNITNTFIQRFLNIGLKIFYIAAGLVSDNVIVFEQQLKNRLKTFIPQKKITVLSLAIEKKFSINQLIAKKRIGLKKDDFAVLVFGFINGYKGIPWIMEKFVQKSDVRRQNSEFRKLKDVKLVIAGGKNPYLKDRPFYQEFYQYVSNFATRYDNITHTGFIPDDKVRDYFSAADVIVLPYEVFMSASGPFSLALSYKKPLLLSAPLKQYAQSYDFMRVLKAAKLDRKDIFFNLDDDSLLELIGKAQNSIRYRNKLNTFSAQLAEFRSSETVVAKLHRILSAAPASQASVFARPFRFLLQS